MQNLEKLPFFTIKGDPLILGGQKVTQHGKKGTRFFFIFFLIRCKKEQENGWQKICHHIWCTWDTLLDSAKKRCPHTMIIKEKGGCDRLNIWFFENPFLCRLLFNRHILSRPGRSQGLLYKQPRSLYRCKKFHNIKITK